MKRIFASPLEIDLKEKTNFIDAARLVRWHSGSGKPSTVKPRKRIRIYGLFFLAVNECIHIHTHEKVLMDIFLNVLHYNRVKVFIALLKNILSIIFRWTKKKFIKVSVTKCVHKIRPKQVSYFSRFHGHIRGRFPLCWNWICESYGFCGVLLLFFSYFLVFSFSQGSLFLFFKLLFSIHFNISKNSIPSLPVFMIYYYITSC